MQFMKYHGLGNDFVLTLDLDGSVDASAERAVRICNRHTGIGADGWMLVRRSETCDIQMFLYNSDGSVAEMCGNGLRCFAKCVYDRGIVKKEDFTVETLAGVMRVHVTAEDGVCTLVTANIGAPSFDRAAIPMVGEGVCDRETVTALDRSFTLSACLMGVPHAIVIVDGSEVTEEDFERLGPAIESHDIFPKKINVNFARIIDKNNVAVRTWERGAGPTLACGTGSCATVCVLSEMGLLERSADVHLAAGTLHIEYGDTVYMTGAAEYVFKGEAL